MSVAPAPGSHVYQAESRRNGESANPSGPWQPSLRLSQNLQQRLRCPACGASLELTRENCACRLSGCQKRYQVVRGVPVLLDEDWSLFDLRQALSRPEPQNAVPRDLLLRRLRTGLPTLSGNSVATENLEQLRRLLLERNPRPRVLVVGGASVGVGMHVLLSDPRIECVESDVRLSDRTHLVFDGHRIPIDSSTFDGVVIQAVLEHVADPEQCVREIHRVLNADGLVYAETAFMQQVHAGRHDFTRFTPVGHRRLFRAFRQITAGSAGGPAVGLAWAWQHFLLSFTTSARGRAVATVVGSLSAFWLKYLDRLLLHRPPALDGASACFFLGSRQEFELTDREAIAVYPGAQGRGPDS